MICVGVVLCVCVGGVYPCVYCFVRHRVLKCELLPIVVIPSLVSVYAIGGG